MDYSSRLGMMVTIAKMLIKDQKPAGPMKQLNLTHPGMLQQLASKTIAPRSDTRDTKIIKIHASSRITVMICQVCLISFLVLKTLPQ